LVEAAPLRAARDVVGHRPRGEQHAGGARRAVGLAAPFRTPKFRIEGAGDGWRGKRYRLPWNGWVLLELALGGYFAWAVFALVQAERYAPIAFFGLYLFGFLYVGILSLMHARRG
jgi:hypothetical protein